MTVSARALAVSFGKPWTTQSRASRIARSPNRNAIGEPAAFFYDDSPMFSDIDHLTTSWLFWHAFTEGVIPERSVLDSAGASSERSRRY